jgi:hypothetical protein
MLSWEDIEETFPYCPGGSGVPSIQWLQGARSAGVKPQRRVADQSPSTNADVEKT